MAGFVIFSDASIPDDTSSDTFRTMPIRSAGPYRIATEIRKLNVSCVVISFAFQFSNEEILKICENLIEADTLAVGISTTFWYNLSQDKRNILRTIITFAKRKNIKIVVGGTMSRNYAESIKFDAAFDSYAEQQLVPWFKNIINNQEPPTPDEILSSGTPFYSFNQKNNFDFNSSKIEYCNTDFINNGESTVIEIARGCIFKCDFCAYPLNGKKKLDYIKDPKILREEFLSNYENYGITNYTFSDDTFNDSTYKLELLHKEISTLPFKISFGAYLRLDLLNVHREQVQLLKELGLKIPFFGIETLSRESGKYIGKGADPEKLIQFLNDLKHSDNWGEDVKFIVGLISGLPGETESSHNRTKDWINDPTNTVDRVRPAALMIANPLTDRYLYKSKFQMEASKHGFYWAGQEPSWKNYSQWCKNYEQAVSLADDLVKESKENDRDMFGWSALSFQGWSAGTDREVTINEILKMNRSEYKGWFNKNYEPIAESFLQGYKNKVLSL